MYCILIGLLTLFPMGEGHMAPHMVKISQDKPKLDNIEGIEKKLRGVIYHADVTFILSAISTSNQLAISTSNIN